MISVLAILRRAMGFAVFKSLGKFPLRENFMKRIKVALLLSMGLAALNGTTLLAQFPYGGPTNGMSASATERVTLKPEKLRLLMLIKAQGGDAKSALASMNEHKVFVKKELEGMKADKDSIVFSPIRASTSDGDSNGNSRRAMQMQMQMSGGRGSKPAAPKPLPTVYTVTCTLKADWPLPVKEGDALALLPVTLKEQIKSRDIAGEKNKPKLGKAEQEQLEELDAMMSEQYSYGGEQNGQGPNITFIAKVPEDVQKKATASAFKKAVMEVETASGATGLKLGKLTAVTTASVPQDPTELYAARGYGRAQNVLSSGFLKEEGASVSDVNADELSYVVTVMVSYNIE